MHTPEIEVTSESTATGVWALEDFVRFAPGFKLHAYGHYTETYIKVDDTWRFQSSTLTRVREDLMTLFLTFQLTDRLKAFITKLAPGLRQVTPGASAIVSTMQNRNSELDAD